MNSVNSVGTDMRRTKQAYENTSTLSLDDNELLLIQAKHDAQSGLYRAIGNHGLSGTSEAIYRSEWRVYATVSLKVAIANTRRLEKI